jgi:long-chain fatty acid transport protein
MGAWEGEPAEGRGPTGRAIVAATLAALMAGAGSAPASASAFALREQSIAAQGNAFAGATAAAEDPSYMFFNPAALARQRGSQVVSVATYIRPVITFDADDARTVGGIAIGGGNGGGDVGHDAVLPAFYAVWDVGSPFGVFEHVNLGLAVNVPFGLETDYNAGWIGRYHALQSKLKTVNVGPTIGIEVVSGLSVGGGLQVEYAHAELSNAIDFGTIGAAISALAPISQPTLQDGRGRVEGDDLAYGFAGGVLYEPWPGTRVGAGYRSPLRHELDGDARFRLDQAGIGAAIAGTTGAFTSTGARAKLHLPETVSFGAYHDLDDQWAVMGEAAWTRWSRFDELKIRFNNPAQPDSVTEEEWRDTWFVAVGATWRPDTPWTVRFGLAYDQSPIPNAKRTPRVPDNDRYWLSVGAAYRPVAGFDVGVGYTHIFQDDASIKLAATDPGNRRHGGVNGWIGASVSPLP